MSSTYSLITGLLFVLVVSIQAEDLDNLLQTRLRSVLMDDQVISDTTFDELHEQAHDSIEERHHLQLKGELQEALHDSTFSHFQISNKMYFDCFERTKANCENDYCTWKDNKCMVSAGSYELLCSYYCDTSICIQLPPLTPPGTMVCPVKPYFIEGLCQTMQNGTNCNNQQGMCVWKPNNKIAHCQDTPSCCSLSEKYCQQKNKNTLEKAMNACGPLVTDKTVCAFYESQCIAPTSAPTLTP